MQPKINLSTLSDESLIQKTLSLAKEERELLLTLLEHFREIERRRLFSSFGYKSLFEMGVKHFGYSETQCYRRITAMRLVREIPQIEQKIMNGNLNLTHLSLAHSLFKKEKKSNQEFTVDQKVSTLELIANQTTREAERRVISLSSHPHEFKTDRAKIISENRVELRFTATLEVQKKIDKLKGLFAHSNPGISLGALFEKLCDIALVQQELVKKTAASKKRRVIELPKTTGPEQPVTTELSYAQLRACVFERAQNKCQNCGSTYALEIDHIKPRALGGSSQLENLRLLCRACNQRAAIIAFGVEKMSVYLK